MKGHTDINQSKKLAEILPLESADMYYSLESVNSAGYYRRLNIASEGYFDDGEAGSDIPCWSLVTLLNVLPQGYSLGNKKSNGKYYICMTCVKHDVIEYDNPVDACMDMIEKLHEMKML